MKILKMNGEVLMQNTIKFNINNIGNYLITERRIEQLINVNDKGNYTYI